jgi:hypothetical protein
VGRRFITKIEIDELADRGEVVLEVDDRTTVTDLAREHARQRGVRLVRNEGHPGEAGTEALAPASATDPSADEVRAAVRSAVLGQLGEVPPGLDRAIDRVLGQR